MKTPDAVLMLDGGGAGAPMEKMQEAVMDILKDTSKKYSAKAHTSIPVPKVHFEESDLCPDTSCFVPGTPVLTDGGVKSIEDIAIGDMVLSHDGLFHPVARIFRREYTGDLVSIRATGVTLPTTSTPEHPFLVHSGDGRSYQYKDYTVGYSLLHPRNTALLQLGRTWMGASTIGALDYVVSPVPAFSRDTRHINVEDELEDYDYGRDSTTKPTKGKRRHATVRKALRRSGGKASIAIFEKGIDITDELLYVLGLYLAEGSTDRSTVDFSLAKDETGFAEKIKKAFADQCHGVSVRVWEPRSYAGLRVSVFSSVLTKLFRKWFGSGAHEKRIPAWIFSLPKERLAHFIAGYGDGDGFVGGGNRKGHKYFDTVSRNIAYQLYFALLKMGNNPQLLVDKTRDRLLNGKVVKGGSDHYRIMLYSPTNKRFIHESFGYKPIRSVVRSPSYDGYVYNLEVEGANSYTANTLAVHNCTALNQNQPISSAQVFYNPKQFSNRTTLHEWYHYMATVLGPEKIKEVLGDEFEGDPDSEEEADRFAMMELETMLPAGKKVVAADSHGLREHINMVPPPNRKMSQEVAILEVDEQPLLDGITPPDAPEVQAAVDNAGVVEEELKIMTDSNVFQRAEWLYRGIAGYLKTEASVLNEAYTPELLGTGTETVISLLATPLGTVTFNFLAGLVLQAAASLGAARLGKTDRVVLTQWAAHHMTRFITLANPRNMQGSLTQARTFGAMLGSGNLAAAFNQMIIDPLYITSQFRSMQAFWSQILPANVAGALNGLAAYNGAPNFAAFQPSQGFVTSGAPQEGSGVAPFQ